VVAALHARSVESPLPLLVTATVAKASLCLWSLPRAAPGPHGGRGRLNPGSYLAYKICTKNRPAGYTLY